jgi:hypothetical protein
MVSEAGKGSKQRPTDQDAYSKNYDAIFSKKTKENPEKVVDEKKKEQ